MDRRENGQLLVRRFFWRARSILMRTHDSAVEHIALAVVLLCASLSKMRLSTSF